ncbi:hypothetical protein L6164_015576 [Bauhinia variegata]|uniref:Uncharacterized protein n=1 Tax=Bauhinia variegata TaxID=167791 RepID=A0ACB9NLT6_BAUVA|nr:hypothetical protein L6164_015576 [Bauhinia variegata]
MGREIDFLAGIVMCEVLLLKMCLEFEPGIRKAEQENKLCNSAIQIITGFRNYYFLHTLFRMMLEPVLPVISLLVNRGSTIYVKNLKDLAVAWLFVADLAIQSAREQGDYEKAMSYVNAFFRSCIPLQLINWVTSQSEMGTNISKPNVSTPIALLKWLLLVEDQGLVVFDGDTAKLRAKAKVCTSRTEYVFPVVRHFHNDLDSNLLGNSIYGATEEDKFGGDIEMVDSMDTMILAADNRMSSNTADGTRKREEMLEDETKSQVKFMRCQFHGNSMRENSLVFGQE